MGLIPGSARSHGGGNGNPLPYSCLENPLDRGAWQAPVHGVTKSQTRLSTHACSVSDNPNLQIHLTQLFPLHMRMSVLYICVSIPALLFSIWKRKTNIRYQHVYVESYYTLIDPEPIYSPTHIESSHLLCFLQTSNMLHCQRIYLGVWD